MPKSKIPRRNQRHGIPPTEICNRDSPPRASVQLFKNIIYSAR